MDIKKILSGQVVLEAIDSPINGHIKVIKDLAFGTYIQVDGLTQSGGIVNSIWGKTLKRIYKFNLTVNNCLILGLGGGTVAGLVRKYWRGANITGVDVDPLIVELGKMYLGLDESRIEVVISDAFEFLTNNKKQNMKKYGLIIIDTYCGFEYPPKFESTNYLKLVRSLLTDSGIAVFNRLYFKDKRPFAVKFGNKLEKIFPNVEWFYPEANLMLICSKRT
ncbi:fused MFS/spermidine synthase [Candidatus Woesebacteria bacterium]|nr:fused MFS/spermidine synthase [Candidatus Woesebacteria bacterium]